MTTEEKITLAILTAGLLILLAYGFHLMSTNPLTVFNESSTNFPSA
jgi:hypothetical protein